MAWNTNLQITAHAMSYSAVNDLAKAMKALEGKKIWYGRSRSKARSLLFFFRSLWLKAVSAQTPWDWLT